MTGLYWDEDDGQEGLLTRRSSEHCLDEQEIENFLFQRLSGVSREAVEEHLLFCEACRRRVEEEEKLIEAVRGAAERLEMERIEAENEPPGALPGSKPRWRSPRWAAAAALAVAVIGGTATLRWMRPAALAEVELRAERSGAAEPDKTPVEGQRILLVADLRGLPPLASFRWTVVDPAGALVAEGVVERVEESARIGLDRGLAAGRYWVRIQDPESGMLLREFGLEVRRRE